MLINKYLSAYHYSEYHSIQVNGFVGDIYGKMLQCDFSGNSMIRLLFRLRGMPKDVYSIERLAAAGFTKLDEVPGREIVFGLVTDSPIFNSCKSNISSKDFMQNVDAGLIKAVINFKVQIESNSKHIISTETRVWCGSNALKAKFRFYWFLIKPFSQLIRKSMLRQLKLQIERN